MHEGVMFLNKKTSPRIAESVKVYWGKVKSLADSPRKVAAGAALGLAFDFLPIPVISIPLAYLVARMLHCNPVAAVATVIFFKLAVPFFFTLNLLVGNTLLGFFDHIATPQVVIAGDSFYAPFLSKIVEHGYSFLAGSLINATLVWLAVYYIIIFILERGRRRRDV